MAAFFITLDFITGRCMAADVSDRKAIEWPPHPGRLFMAMAAAGFERGETALANDPESVLHLSIFGEILKFIGPGHQGSEIDETRTKNP